MDRDDAIAITFLALLAISLSAYLINTPNLMDLESYKNALLAKDAIDGKLNASKSVYYYFISLSYMFASQLLGKSKVDSELLVTTVKVSQVLLSIIMTVSLYSLLRNFFTKITSFVSSVLILSSPAFISNGIAPTASPEFFGMAVFLLGVAIFFYSNKVRFYPYALIGGIFIGLSILSWKAGIVVFASLIASILIQIFQKYRAAKADFFLTYSSILILGVGILFTLSTTYEFEFLNLSINEFLANYPLFIPLIALFAVLLLLDLSGIHKYRGEFKYFIFSFSLLSIILSLFNNFSFLPGLAIASSFSIEEIKKLERNFKATLAIFTVFMLLASFVLFNNFLNTTQTIVISVLIAAISAFVVLLYRERGPSKFIVIFILATILFSSFGYSFLNVSSRRSQINDEFVEALSWVKENTDENANVASFGRRELVEFIADRKSQNIDAELARYLLTNSSTDTLIARNVTYVVLYADLFDQIDSIRLVANLSKVRIDSFILEGLQVDESGNIYAVFNSSSGKLAFAPLDSKTGAFLDADVLIAYEGNVVPVPFRKFVIINDNRGQIYRLIYPQLDSYEVNLFKAFFSSVNGLRKVYPEKGGSTLVYEVAR